MATLCTDWEKVVIDGFSKTPIREVRLRIGLVLGDGSALAKMMTPFSLGLGGVLGSGKQWMNWIHRDDLISIILEAMTDLRYKGPGLIQGSFFCTSCTIR